MTNFEQTSDDFKVFNFNYVYEHAFTEFNLIRTKLYIYIKNRLSTLTVEAR